MCGIAGFARLGARDDSSSILARMTGAIRHRGPDDEGFYEDERIALGHRRLSIIDLAGGHQPMSTEDESLWIVYNGEIFNHAELRGPLEQLGHRFRTRCDTEVILHSYEAYGCDCVNHFRGMFAFALWDRSRRRLFCARDRLGKKPFYYYFDGNLFAFASEIKALLEHPDISTSFEESVLPEYLSFGYVSEERTLFRGIHKLMPGHCLVLDCGGERPELEIRQYWDVPRPQSYDRGDDRAWIDECRDRLHEAVRTRLMSDVPLGVFLSGGVDSSTIAAVTTRMVPGPVQTFSVGYREGEHSELGYARQVANHLGTDHHEVLVDREGFFQALPRFIWHEDEPITWPSSIPLGFVAELASRRVKVVLTGEGGDELFAGYARYRHHLMNSRHLRWYRLAPLAVRRRIRSAIATTSLLNGDLRRKLGHTVVGRDADLGSLYLDNFYSALPEAAHARLFGPRSGQENFLAYWNAEPQPSLLARLLYADQKTYLVELLMKQDQMSMSASIESRVPLLDHHFVEFAARCPDHMKLRGGVGKYILRKVAEEYVPYDILYRKKMGFPTPIREWLLHPDSAWIYDMLTAPGGLLSSFVNRNALEQLLLRHRNNAEDATDVVWRLLNLQLWGDLFITGRALPEVFEAPAVRHSH